MLDHLFESVAGSAWASESAGECQRLTLFRSCRKTGFPALVFLFCLLLGFPRGLQAWQGPGSEPETKVARSEPPALASPSEGLTGPGPDTEPEGFFGWMARASGLIGLVLLGLSFYLVAVVAWMFLNCRRSNVVPPALISEVEELLSRKQFDRAYGRVASSESFLGRVLAAGIKKLPAGVPTAQRSMELANEDATMELEHRTTYLATIGTLGPMIGLLGTVYGMIRSFQAIATAGSNPQATQLAAGISTALFVTLEGIALSVPAIAFYAYFRNRIARLSLEAQMVSETLLEQFAAGVRQPHPLLATGQPTLRVALPSKEDPEP